MATVWWWVVPPAQTGDASRPSDARLISTPDTGVEYNALVNGGVFHGMARYQGPFASAAAARAASPGGGSLGEVIGAGVSAGAANDVGVIGTGAKAAKTAASAAGSGLSGLAAIGDFFARLTQGNTWVRIAKVVIGGTLLMVGIAHMTGASGAAFDAARKVPLPV